MSAPVLYNPSTAQRIFRATRSATRDARAHATEALLHDLSALGVVEFFEGGGSDPTGLTGYSTSKLWLRQSSGVQETPGTVRRWNGGTASLLASWPEMTAADWRAYFDVGLNPTFTTIELGASDTTLARLAAGRVTIEGKEIVTVNTTTVTGNVTVSPAATHDLLNLTSGVGTITFTAATGYRTDYQATIVNNTSRGWVIAPDGVTSFTLYPTQVARVMRTGSTWSVENDFRWQTRTTVTFYVNHASGSNANDGLTSGSAFATIQKAIDVIEEFVDCLEQGVAIQVANGTFTESGVVHTKRLTGSHVIAITGDPTTPSNCVWQTASGQTGLTCRDWSGVILNGFRLQQASGSGATLVSASQHGIIDIQNIEFGNCAGGIHMSSVNGGSIGYVTGANVAIVGTSYAVHWYIATESTILCSGVASYTVAAATFTAFLQMIGGAITLAGFTFSGPGAGSGSTGATFSIQPYSALIFNGIALPGATAGFEYNYPDSTGAGFLGTSGNAWTYRYMKSGGFDDWGNNDVRETHSTGKITSTGGYLSSHATSGMGYAAGAGGTVAQSTSKATGVTLNKACGQITMDAAALAAATIVSFVLTNSAIAATDVLVLNHVSGGTIGAYTLNAVCGSGSATIYVRNATAGSLGEALVLRYALVKGATT